VMFKTNMIDGQPKKGSYNTKEHQQAALKIAEEGVVLLKNEAGFLPLSKSKIKKIAVIGYNADRKQSMGGGSSQVRAFYEVTPLQGIRSIAGNAAVTYAKGYNIERGATSDAALIREAADLASASDVVIFVGGWTHGYNYSKWSDNAYDAEDTDKPDMNMPFGQDELLKAVLKANPKTVVVLMGGGAIDMRQWVNTAPAILQAWYPGMEGGNAIAKILFGQTNPSGKLPMTFPKKLEDHGSRVLGDYPGDIQNLIVHYKDDIYVGYRYYDKFNVEPQFAFGHGLSYTSFSYSDLKLVGNRKNLTVSFKVKNTGRMAGAEVTQVYVSPEKPALSRPIKELKGFQKIFLQPGEQKTVTITLGEDAFQYFDDRTNEWTPEKGMHTITIGSSSRDLRLNGRVPL
jgi:beta-glucosidase